MATSFTACGDGSESPKPTSSGWLTAFAVIGEDNNFPLMDESCWDWFPDGDGLYWSAFDNVAGQAIGFPFRRVSKGKAYIEELGEVKTGDVVYVKHVNGIRPLFKIIEIDPSKGGVRLAMVGNIAGNCKPTQVGPTA